MILTQSQMLELKTDIVKEFFVYNVVKVNTKKLFVLSSGLQVPLYLDHRRIFSIPGLRTKVIKAWASMLQEQIKTQFNLNLQGNTDIIFSGTATAGIAPAYGLSSYFESGFIYVRDKAKAHGLNSQIEGVIEPSNKFIVIDDMAVTGGSLLKNGIILQGLYGNERILCASTISCHKSAKMSQTFEQNSIQFFPLFTTKEIFNIAYSTNVIDLSTFEILMDCLESLEKSRS